MIRYLYVDQFQPPAPFLNVTVRSGASMRERENQPALVDTAADRTILPAPLVDALALVADGRASFQGFAGEVVELPLFLVEIQVHDLPPIEARAALGENEPFILLGREVLNRLRILLDGPQRSLEVQGS